MEYIYITTEPDNIASNKIIKKLNADFIEETIIPNDYFAYYDGIDNHNIYKLVI